MAAQAVREMVEIIRHAPLRKLRDVGYVEFELLPALGLCPDAPLLYPASLRTALGGLRSWQYPCQFAPYLVDMAERGVESYIEIGARYGGTFIITVEYLRRFNRIEQAAVIDPFFYEPLARYMQREGFRYLNESSQSEWALRLVDDWWPWDLALIDGDHSEAGFLADWKLMSDNAAIIAVHDADNDGFPWLREWYETYDGDKRGYFAQYPEVVAEQGRHGGIGVIYA